MSESNDARSSGGEQQDNQQTDQPKPMYEARCDNCGIIDCGNEHPTGDFGPECPACGAVLRTVVELDDPADMRDDAISADDLEKARETVSMLDERWDEADHSQKSEMVFQHA